MARSKAQRKQSICGKMRRRCKSCDLSRSSKNFLELLDILKVDSQYLGYEYTRNLFGKSKRWISSARPTGLQRERRRMARLNAAANTARVGKVRDRANQRSLRKPRQQAGRRSQTGQNNAKMSPKDNSKYFILAKQQSQLDLTKEMTNSEMSLYCDLLILDELEKDDALHAKIHKFCSRSPNNGK